MDNVLEWVEKNPWLAAIIGIGGVLIIMWLLGFFSSSSSSTSSSNQGTNLAAAYYNAEAAQTTAGTQLQMATEYYTNQTAQAQIQANGAEAIASTQAGMYTTLGQQNASTTTALGNDQLLASENSNDDALNASNTAAMYGYQTANAGYNASIWNTAMGTVIPQELALSGGYGNFALPGYGAATVNTGVGITPNILESQGFTPTGAAQLYGLPASGIA